MSRSRKKGDLSKGRRPQGQTDRTAATSAPTTAERLFGGGPLLPAIARLAGRRECLIAAALAAAVFLAYQPAWNGGFIWDDDVHLLNNPVLKPGHFVETWVPWAAHHYLNYWPLTFSVYRLEFELWGLDPLGYHLVNIGLHVVSALLVWKILQRLRVPGAVLAAAIFALHPVNVESVAWITQLKNTLSLCLTLLSVLLYLHYDEDGGRWRLAASLGLFLLAALAKGMALTLPVVLLACAWWQRGSIRWRDVLRMIPFVLIAALMVGMEIYQQHVAAGGVAVRSDSLLSRAVVAGCAVWFYFGKVIWPTHLVFVYPRWEISQRDLWAYLPGASLVVLLALAWWRRHSWGRPLLMLLVCYVALLLPVLGFVNIYFMDYSLVADHWQYAAMIVPSAALAAAAVALARRLRLTRSGGYAACAALLAVLAGLTAAQSRMYAEVETLYTTTIAANPQCQLAHVNLGRTLAKRGQIDEAIRHYRAALEIKPKDAVAHNDLGDALEKRGRIDEAIAQYREALRLDPHYAHAHRNLGGVLARRGQIDEAIAECREAVRLDSRDAEARNNLGAVLARRGLTGEAEVYYREALEIDPNNALAHCNLGGILAGHGMVDQAIEHFRKAVEIRSDYEHAHLSLGGALAMRGRLDEAVEHYQMALRINPRDPVAHCQLGSVLLHIGQIDEAIAHFQTALRISPDYAEARQKLRMAEAMRDANPASRSPSN